MRPATEAERRRDIARRADAITYVYEQGLYSRLDYEDAMRNLAGFDGYPREVEETARERYLKRPKLGHGPRVRLPRVMGAGLGHSDTDGGIQFTSDGPRLNYECPQVESYEIRDRHGNVIQTAAVGEVVTGLEPGVPYHVVASNSVPDSDGD